MALEVYNQYRSNVYTYRDDLKTWSDEDLRNIVAYPNTNAEVIKNLRSIMKEISDANATLFARKDADATFNPGRAFEVANDEIYTDILPKMAVALQALGIENPADALPVPQPAVAQTPADIPVNWEVPQIAKSPALLGIGAATAATVLGNLYTNGALVSGAATVLNGAATVLNSAVGYLPSIAFLGMVIMILATRNPAAAVPVQELPVANADDHVAEPIQNPQVVQEPVVQEAAAVVAQPQPEPAAEPNAFAEFADQHDALADVLRT